MCAIGRSRTPSIDQTKTEVSVLASHEIFIAWRLVWVLTNSLWNWLLSDIRCRRGEVNRDYSKWLPKQTMLNFNHSDSTIPSSEDTRTWQHCRIGLADWLVPDLSQRTANQQRESVITAKINAVKSAFQSAFPHQAFEFIGVSVESEVDDQPICNLSIKQSIIYSLLAVIILVSNGSSS